MEGGCVPRALSIVIGLLALTALPAAAETFAGAGIDYSCERWTADRRQDGLAAATGWISVQPNWSATSKGRLASRRQSSYSGSKTGSATPVA
jgi:hypothetical protein